MVHAARRLGTRAPRSAAISTRCRTAAGSTAASTSWAASRCTPAGGGGGAGRDRAARQLGRRGRGALRAFALRFQRGGGLDGRPGRAARAPRRRRHRAAGRARRARRRPRPRDRGPKPARDVRPRISSCTSSRARCSSRSSCRSASCSGRSASSATSSRGEGQAAHAGSTPMDARRDALAGAAKLALELRHIAERAGGGAVCTSGGVVCKPGIVTSVVETAEQLLDQRHLDADTLAAMLADAKECSERFAAEESIDVSFEKIWSIEPILFHPELIELADEAILEVTPTSHRLPSGPLHDAAEVARAGVPTVMLFVPEPPRPLSHEARGHEGRAPRAGRPGARPADDRRRSPGSPRHEALSGARWDVRVAFGHATSHGTCLWRPARRRCHGGGFGFRCP